MHVSPTALSFILLKITNLINSNSANFEYFTQSRWKFQMAGHAKQMSAGNEENNF